MTLRTPEEALTELSSKGVSITQWALSQGFSPQLATMVLREFPRRGRYGRSHEIAIALGLKAGEICQDPSLALAPKS
ncbi:DNA-binding protein [Pandoraea apista]|nr:DNA-binding protein [Pandoraea apista]RRW99004.1 DNA-binding protein [Pandoraea apista]